MIGIASAISSQLDCLRLALSLQKTVDIITDEKNYISTIRLVVHLLFGILP